MFKLFTLGAVRFPVTVGYEVKDCGYSTPCWLWIGNRSIGNYGKVKRDGRNWMAHVYTYVKKYGPVPEGKELDHLCCQRPCINPDHVQPVTPSVNKQRGNGTPFDAADIAKIVSHYKSGESQYKIAKSLGVGQGTISRILLGQRWSNVVTVPVQTRSPIKLTREQVQEIVLLCAMGTPQRDAAFFYGVGPSQISRIVRGESWS